jgi:hypothetical protein
VIKAYVLERGLLFPCFSSSDLPAEASAKAGQSDSVGSEVL